MILCFIPARKGSKGVKNKNLKKLNKKPLIHYTLELANSLKKKNFYPFISTDSKKILGEAKKFKINNNYIRPSKLAKDDSNVVDAVIDALKFLSNNNLIFKDILLLEPTNPIRSKKEILNAYKLFKNDKKIESLFSVTKVKESPEEIIRKKNKKWNFLVKKKPNKNGRQFFQNYHYFIDGNFYFVEKKFLLKHKTFIKENKSYPYLRKQVWPIDIDHIDDFKVASVFLK
jgi:CMP-N,N'-diacetyllegionaminic acid synthase